MLGEEEELIVFLFIIHSISTWFSTRYGSED
jgi:hypothetical protein